MLPLFTLGKSAELSTTPILQRIFEGLFDEGIREFYFIVGKSKRAVQDHFNPDHEYVELLEGQDKIAQASELLDFYRKLNESFLIWVNQPRPKGFGHAVLLYEPLMCKDESFLVHAGDTFIISETGIFERLSRVHFNGKAQATLTLKEVSDPRRFGIATVEDNYDGTFDVKRVVEKPEKSESHLAIMALYAFDPEIFKALKMVTPGRRGEIQLTDAIQKLIDMGMKVQALKMGPKDYVLDVGTPETYWDALEFTHRYFEESARLRET
jgi:UTP--glucose-1-phosphate uridylyltransferase